MNILLLLLVITGVVLVYIVVGTVVGYILYWVEVQFDEDYLSVIGGVFWPIALPILITWYVVMRVIRSAIQVLDKYKDFISKLYR